MALSTGVIEAGCGYGGPSDVKHMALHVAALEFVKHERGSESLGPGPSW